MNRGLDIIRLLIPLAVGFASGWICPLQDAGKGLPATPPGWVFGLVWFILYLLLGITWIFAARLGRFYDLAFAIQVILLASWVFAYGCRGNKRISLYIIFLCLLVAFGIAFSLASQGSQWCIAMCPLIVWLLFASMLNFATVNQELI